MQNKRPFTSLAKVEEIAAEIPTPFHLYDEAGIRDRCRRLKSFLGTLTSMNISLLKPHPIHTY